MDLTADFLNEHSADELRAMLDLPLSSAERKKIEAAIKAKETSDDDTDDTDDSDDSTADDDATDDDGSPFDVDAFADNVAGRVVASLAEAERIADEATADDDDTDDSADDDDKAAKGDDKKDDDEKDRHPGTEHWFYRGRKKAG
jgi:hypothetical protein